MQPTVDYGSYGLRAYGLGYYNVMLPVVGRLWGGRSGQLISPMCSRRTRRFRDQNPPQIRSEMLSTTYPVDKSLKPHSNGVKNVEELIYEHHPITIWSRNVIRLAGSETRGAKARGFVRS